MRPLISGRRAGFTKPNPRHRQRTRFGAVLLVSLIVGVACGGGTDAGSVEEITVDWAYYNPVSLVLKEKGWLEEELEGTTVNWVQSAGSNKALEFLAARSIDFGSSAGAAALLAKINGTSINSVYAYSQPEWTALVTNADSGISKVEDLAGKTVAVTRGTDPYIFLVRALGRPRADRGRHRAGPPPARRRAERPDQR